MKGFFSGTVFEGHRFTELRGVMVGSWVSEYPGYGLVWFSGFRSIDILSLSRFEVLLLRCF